MDGDRRGGSLRGRSNAQFKKKGGGSKKGRWNDSRPEHRGNPQIPNPSDTVYRILCPSKNIGSVIGKGGSIIKVLREETQSKITVSDTFPGSDERVIMIYSPPEKVLKDELDEGGEDGSMNPHCPAQDALLRVHERILEEDFLAAKEEGDDMTVTCRLLVPECLVGCLLGKGGDVIRRLRSETTAGIRVLPSEHLPTCALSTDELVQIQGNPTVVKRALYEVSTLLHQNPRKEKAPNYVMPSRAQAFHPVGRPVTNLPLAHGSMWSPRHHSPHMPPPPWIDDYERHAGYPPGRYDDGFPRPGMEPSGEFSLKILCSDSKIGGVIGKGGINVRQLQQDTGTSIHAEDLTNQSEERVIRVSAFETLANQRSQTIDAILLLQNKASEVSDKGVITTRLLVPSNKVGCLLGQGGTIINEMRRRTHADIRVYSKDEKPECAAEDEELVQISGSFGVAKDALGEIASRLRERCLKDASVEAEPAPPRPVHGYGPTGSFSRGGPPIPGPVGLGPSGGYNAVRGGMPGYGSPGYPVQSSASRYPNPNSSVEPHYQSSAVESAPGTGGNVYPSNAEAAGMKPHDPYLSVSESMADVHGGSDHLPPGTHQNYNGQTIPHQSPYTDTKGQAAYHSTALQQSAWNPTPYQPQAPYQSHQQTAYQNPQQSAYQNPQQSAYQNPQTAYQNSQQTPYQPTEAQPSPYTSMNAQHNAYQSAPTTQGGYQY
ncbi:KH domain-containing protein At4g18375-like [Silene latifolia]|uniref:KH domain-containing protein At4g18375-like n=1 Tax=Silene latifolia TaxID=37657 RepID=UPI003D76F9B9